LTIKVKDALKAAAAWGDSLTLTGTMLLAARENTPHGLGIPLVVPDLPYDVEIVTDRLRAVTQTLGDDLTITVRVKRSELRVVLTSPDRGEVALPARRAASAAPEPPAGATWTTLSAESVDTLRRMSALAAPSDAATGTQFALTGVRVSPWYLAVTNGRCGVCQWETVAVDAPVSIPASFVRKLPNSELELCIGDGRCWFRSADGTTWWTLLLTGEWPDTIVHDLLPDRRDAEGIRFPIPECFADTVKVAAAAWADRSVPMRLTVSGRSLTLDIEGDTRVHRRWQGMPDGFAVVGVDPALLAEILSVLPASNLTISVGDSATSVYLHASGARDVEAVVVPMYLPRVSS
jgi:hypothetical protein